MSAFEHQAQPMIYQKRVYHLDYLSVQPGSTHIDDDGNLWSGNFCGWVQFRQTIENEHFEHFEKLKK
jgi:hypothetical protein